MALAPDMPDGITIFWRRLACGQMRALQNLTDVVCFYAKMQSSRDR
ncbi:MAG: hypothetical protein MRK00_02525 [Nitrosomonas sp.]|nr:hypothetical protein [Nitrosomonas sp.]